MGQAPQEREDLRLRFGAFATNYQEAMDGLYRITHQTTLAKRPNETLEHLVALLDALIVSKPEDALEERLVPLTEEDIEALGRNGSFRILPLFGKQPLGQLKDIPVESPFREVYVLPCPVTVVDLCPEGEETKSGMRLVAIRADNPKDDIAGTEEFPYNIGWVTEEELESLIQKE